MKSYIEFTVYDGDEKSKITARFEGEHDCEEFLSRCLDFMKILTYRDEAISESLKAHVLSHDDKSYSTKES